MKKKKFEEFCRACNKISFLCFFSILVLISFSGLVSATYWNVSTQNYTNTYYSAITVVTANHATDFRIINNESKFYIMDYSGKRIYQYKMNTIGNISSSTYTSTSKDLSLIDGTPYSFDISNDGSKMLMLGLTAGKIYYLTMSTPFNISTLTSSSSFAYTAYCAAGGATGIRTNGTYIFMNCFSDGKIHSWKMSSPWFFSSATYQGSKTVAGANAIQSLDVKYDGKIVYIADTAHSVIKQFLLNNAWDITSTWNQSTNKSVSSQTTSLTSLSINASDGKTNYVLSLADSKIFQYKLSQITPNATITAKSTYNSSSINSFSVKIQNKTTIRYKYTSTGTITTLINSTQALRNKYNLTFYNNSNHFNTTILNYNFSAHGNTTQINATRSFTYINLKNYYNTSQILTPFNVTVNGVNYLGSSRTTKIYLNNNNYNNITINKVNYFNSIALNKNTSVNYTVYNIPYFYYFSTVFSNYTYFSSKNYTRILRYGVNLSSIKQIDFLLILELMFLNIIYFD